MTLKKKEPTSLANTSQSSLVQRVENTLQITNKLLATQFSNEIDYLTWWYSLEEIWKEIFWMDIYRHSLLSLLKNNRQYPMSNEEEILTKFNRELDRNNQEMINASLKLITKDKKIIIGRGDNFELKDLNPLKIFTELEEIQFINADIKNIDGLCFLKKLKIIDVSRSKIVQSEIEEFMKVHSECKVLF